MKDASEELLEETALAVQRMCREHGATFIIDDNVLLTKRIGANGVHLGKNDMPIAEARKILGNDYIIGSTVNTFEDITNTLHSATPDYFGCGPFRYTTTKQNLSPTLGLEGYRAIVDQMRKHNIRIPIVAIGGIGKEDIPAIMMCGVNGIALSSSILNAQDPVAEMQEVLRLL
jgi:thiamine-phosphate pyrophosphorylase